MLAGSWLLFAMAEAVVGARESIELTTGFVYAPDGTTRILTGESEDVGYREYMIKAPTALSVERVWMLEQMTESRPTYLSDRGGGCGYIVHTNGSAAARVAAQHQALGLDWISVIDPTLKISPDLLAPPPPSNGNASVTAELYISLVRNQRRVVSAEDSGGSMARAERAAARMTEALRAPGAEISRASVSAASWRKLTATIPVEQLSRAVALLSRDSEVRQNVRRSCCH